MCVRVWVAVKKFVKKLRLSDDRGRTNDFTPLFCHLDFFVQVPLVASINTHSCICMYVYVCICLSPVLIFQHYLRLVFASFAMLLLLLCLYRDFCAGSMIYRRLKTGYIKTIAAFGQRLGLQFFYIFPELNCPNSTRDELKFEGRKKLFAICC